MEKTSARIINYVFTFFAFFLFFSRVSSQEALSHQVEANTTDIVFEPDNLIDTISGKTYLVEWYTSLPEAHHASVEVLDEMVSKVIEFEETFDLTSEDGNVTGRGRMNVSAEFVGFQVINLTIYDINNETIGSQTLKMTVLISYGRLNIIFTYILTIFIFIIYVNMGATLDFTVVKRIARKPIGPGVGIVCQYGFMPLIAFTLAKLVFSGNELRQLGMFLNGASPGGGGSNIWTYLLGGSLDLSIMMTFVSTLVAFGAVPLWVLTLGPKIIGEGSAIQIPYDQIAYMVVSLVVPCCLGLLIQRFLPKVAKVMETKILPVFAVLNIIFISTVGIYSHRYIFALFNYKLVLACFGLPSLGYLSGFLMSLLTRRPKKEIIAISIETGIQNATIPIVILKLTLGHPAGDLAVVVPACTVFMTPILPLCAFVIKMIYLRLTRSGGKDILTPIESEKQVVDQGIVNRIVLPDLSDKDTEKGVTKDAKLSRDPTVQNGTTLHLETRNISNKTEAMMPNGVSPCSRNADMSQSANGRVNGFVPCVADDKFEGSNENPPIRRGSTCQQTECESSSRRNSGISECGSALRRHSENKDKLFGVDNPAVDLSHENL